MRAASDEFARAVATSHQIVTRVDVLFDRQVIVEDVDLLDGTITFDRTAARLASLDVTLLDPLRIPTGPADVLTPERLFEAYQSDLHVFKHPAYGTPVILPNGRH